MSLSTLCFGIVTAVLFAAINAQAGAQPDTQLPSVNLGYEIHQAIALNSTGGYYNFSNIRYAQAPVGNLRFAKPEAPRLAVDQSTLRVENGSINRWCPQGNQAWNAIGGAFAVTHSIGQPLDFAAANASIANAPPSPQPPQVTEDCLFLDVMAPKQTFDAAQRDRFIGLPVLVWIHGGGYTQFSKDFWGNPAGLVHSGNVVYVQINYRLGAFGFLGGPTYKKSGLLNAGLWDQRLALKWVQDNIALFGGDRNKVTIFGESAGAGSILHQITAFGGQTNETLFQNALPQSIALLPGLTSNVQEDVYQSLLTAANVTTFKELRALPSDELIAANAKIVSEWRYGLFYFGPTVDGTLIPELPGPLLANGQFDKSITVANGHQSNEGLLFTPPFIDSDQAFADHVKAIFTNYSAADLAYITKTLYPPIFNGKLPYRNQIDRTAFFLSESLFTCWSGYLSKAFSSNSNSNSTSTQAYVFGHYPGIHSQDTSYTFYNGPKANKDMFGTYSDRVGDALQEYIISFAKTGKLTSGVPPFPNVPAYEDGQVLLLNDTSKIIDDPTMNERCAWWQTRGINGPVKLNPPKPTNLTGELTG